VTQRADDDLRIGCVKYLNARPLIDGWDGPVEFDHPAALCDRLSGGDLDVALVSSFEFLREPSYRIVDGVSIASVGPVYSVVVAHSGDFADVREIELDPASRTSVKLLRCVFGERRLSPTISARTSEQGGQIPESRGRLLIGDQAIRFRSEFGARYNYLDLGQEWSRITALPFVYALWLVRPEVENAASIADKLRSLAARNLTRLDEIAASQPDFYREFCARYYKEHLRFGFAEPEKEGLLTFARLCEKHRLLPARPISLSLV
jgi:predicted solute-binding protein